LGKSFLYSVAPLNGCHLEMTKYFCSQAFMPCHYETPVGAYGPPVTFPRPLCNSNCVAFNSKCAPLIAAQPSLAANCSATGAITGMKQTCDGTVTVTGEPNFPATTINLVIAKPMCNSYTANNNGTLVAQTIQFHVSCPGRLVLPIQSNTPNRINGGSCSTPCPLITFNESDYNNSDRLARGLAVCSFILTVFLLSTWLVFPEKRKQ
jgi:hypothetical protein